MKSAICNGVRGFKLPIWHVRLNDLKTRRHPIQRLIDIVQGGIRLWRLLESENNLWLDSWLANPRKRENMSLRTKRERCIPNCAPNWTKDVVARPDRTVCKSNLVATRCFTSGEPQRTNSQCVLIGRMDVIALSGADRLRPAFTAVVIGKKLFRIHPLSLPSKECATRDTVCLSTYFNFSQTRLRMLTLPSSGSGDTGVERDSLWPSSLKMRTCWVPVQVSFHEMST
ncbi:hypothetical protein MCEMAEM4_01533 [Burkholderiaceae bacterium]